MIEIYLIHPVFVHFTIALFSLAVLLDILGRIFKKESFHVASWLNLLGSGLAVIATVIFGVIAESRAPHTDAGHELVKTHETIGFIVLGIILVLAIWRLILKGKLPVKGVAVYFAISIIGILLMFTGAYYGGEMVYTHGYGVKTAVAEEGVPHEHNEAEQSTLEKNQSLPESEAKEDSAHALKDKMNKATEHKQGVTHFH
ncbi:MAG: DUF2231 domain-containing protein [Calditrichaeota bacterium]|nr:DUF2231 domain-containing protein [Calditrichota bacterium]